jgi:hypothetical protein
MVFHPLLDNRFFAVSLNSMGAKQKRLTMKYVIGAIIGAAVGFGIYLVSSTAGVG